MKQSVEQLYELFSRITGVTINQMNQYHDMMLPTGKAISAAAAAHCLLEMKRTAVFLRGIDKAIEKKKEPIGEDRAVRILYAGTGPYGTLIVPLLSLYEPGSVEVDLLDVQHDALSALREIIRWLSLESFIGNVYCNDATQFNPEKRYDIIISETMQAALANEPQVAVMQHLIPCMPANGIFIPESITVEAWLTDPRHESRRMLAEEYHAGNEGRIFLGKVFRIDKKHLSPEGFACELILPEERGNSTCLKLLTTVKVYGQEKLGENESSITMPVTLCGQIPPETRAIEFGYRQGEKPGIEFRAK
jgi:hypothetical protein